MTSEEFVEAIKLYVRDAAIRDVTSICSKPPGRTPENRLVEASGWFNSLGETEKSTLEWIVKEAVDYAVFGLLCVLDGVRVIEEPGDRGELRLLYVKGSEQVLLNDPNKEFLHDLFNATTME